MGEMLERMIYNELLPFIELAGNLSVSVSPFDAIAMVVDLVLAVGKFWVVEH